VNRSILGGLIGIVIIALLAVGAAGRRSMGDHHGDEAAGGSQ